MKEATAYCTLTGKSDNQAKTKKIQTEDRSKKMKTKTKLGMYKNIEQENCI
jgi:hypothetical protein